jgi:hypothetical protein
MGGSNDASNLVCVTVEQHAELHKQLWEDLGHEQDKIAWHFLSGQIGLDEAKRRAIIQAGQTNKGRKNIHKNGIVKKVYPDQLDEYLKEGWSLGRNLSFKHTEETKQYLSKINQGKVYTIETLTKMRYAKLGNKATEETKQKMCMSHKKRNEK